MASTRPLVGGFLERISVKALERYHKEITDLAKAEHGVYALYKKDRLYYVGLAVNLRRRIKQHLKDKHAGRWNRFSLYLVRKVDHIKEIESLLLRIAHPSGNKHAGRLKGAVNLERRLRRLMEQHHMAEIAEIFSRSRSGKRVVPPRRRRKVKADTGRRRTGTVRRSLHGTAVAGKRIYASYKGKDYKAIVYHNGRIKFAGQLYDNPSAAGRAITKKPLNGWVFWRFRKNGELVKLSELRPKE